MDVSKWIIVNPNGDVLGYDKRNPERAPWVPARSRSVRQFNFPVEAEDEIARIGKMFPGSVGLLRIQEVVVEKSVDVDQDAIRINTRMRNLGFRKFNQRGQGAYLLTVGELKRLVMSVQNRPIDLEGGK